MDAGLVARALHAELRPRKLPGKVVGQIDVDQPQAGDLAQLEQVPRHGGHQGGQVGADVGDRKRDLDLAAVIGAAAFSVRAASPCAALYPGAGERGLINGGQRIDPRHARAGAALQFVGLARQRQKGAARLLAGDHFRHFLDRIRTLDPIAGAELGAFNVIVCHGFSFRSRENSSPRRATHRRRGARIWPARRACSAARGLATRPGARPSRPRRHRRRAVCLRRRW